MSKKFIADVPGVPALTSPISNAVVIGNSCYISGQLALYDDGYRASSAKDEAARAFELVFLIAKEAGFLRSDIVFVDLAFINLNRDLFEVNQLFDQLFDPRPARTIYQAAELPFSAKVKVQAVAMR